MPEISAAGTNTATRTRPIAISAPEISRIVRCAASRGDRPSRMCFSTASTTTIASSTTMPTASTSANSESELIEKPRASWTANVPTSDTGMAMIGMIAARHVCRKRTMTSTTRMIASISVRWTSFDRLLDIFGGVVGNRIFHPRREGSATPLPDRRGRRRRVSSAFEPGSCWMAMKTAASVPDVPRML